MTSIRHNPESTTSPDDAYLDAARDAILAVGWSRTTLTDIARRAGVSRMTLYRRWPDMQTMLADLMTREWSTTVSEAGSRLGSTGEELGSTGEEPGSTTGTDDPLIRISAGVVATVCALRSNALLRRIIDVDPELLLPYLLDRRGRSQEMVAGVLADLIRQGQRAGSIRRGNPDHLARSVLLACHGFALSAHTMVDTEAGTAPRGTDVAPFDAELGRLVERYLQP